MLNLLHCSNLWVCFYISTSSGSGDDSLDGLPDHIPRCPLTPSLSPQKRTTSQSKTEPPLLRTNKRTIYTAGRPPWYNVTGTTFKEAFVIGETTENFHLFLCCEAKRMFCPFELELRGCRDNLASLTPKIIFKLTRQDRSWTGRMYSIISSRRLIALGWLSMDRYREIAIGISCEKAIISACNEGLVPKLCTLIFRP